MTLSTLFNVDGLTKGRQYRFRYRAQNVIGYSGWSPESSLIPAVRPATTPKPAYVSSTAAEITLRFERSPDNGGIAILNYELWIERDSTFALCTTYNYQRDGYSFTLVAADNALTAGSYYRFKYRAQNERGFSDFSDILTVGLGSLPSKPTGLTRGVFGNNQTTIVMDWVDLTG